MNIFQAIGEAIGERAARKAVAQYTQSDEFRAKVRTVVDQTIREHPAFEYMVAMARHYRARCPSLTPMQAWQQARTVLADFLHSEKISFGDPAYDWSASSARDMASEDMDYWESAA